MTVAIILFKNNRTLELPVLPVAPFSFQSKIRDVSTTCERNRTLTLCKPGEK